jgi:hypothetical protein
MIILEIGSIFGLTLLVGITWISNRLPDIARSRDISRIPRWILDEWGYVLEPSNLSRWPKLFKGWRWVLGGLYFLLVAIFVFDSTGRWPFRLLLAAVNFAILGRWIYYIENKMAK